MVSVRDFSYLLMIFQESDCTDVQTKMNQLEAVELQKCLEVSTNRGGANSQVRIRNRLPLTVKDLILLWEIREALPSLTRLFVEDLYEKRLGRILPRQLAWEDYRDQLYLAKTSNWKRGRILKRLHDLLDNFRVFIWQEPRARRRARLRTPSAAGGRSKNFESHSIELDSESTWKEEQHRAYLRSQAEDLQEATRILAREREERSRTLTSAPEAEETALQERKLPNNVSQDSHSENEFAECALITVQGLDASILSLEREKRCSSCPSLYRRKCPSYSRVHQ